MLDRWGDGSVAEALDRVRGVISQIIMHDEAGKEVAKSDVAGFGPGDGYLLWRYRAAQVIRDHAHRLGLDLRYGVRVEEFWETSRHAGITVNDKQISGDCVVIADGMHSRGRNAITGGAFELRDTGSVAYRSGSESGNLRDEPETQWLFEGTEEEDKLFEYVGKDVLVVIGTGRRGGDAFWGCISKAIYSKASFYHHDLLFCSILILAQTHGTKRAMWMRHSVRSIIGQSMKSLQQLSGKHQIKPATSIACTFQTQRTNGYRPRDG